MFYGNSYGYSFNILCFNTISLIPLKGYLNVINL